MLIMGDIDITPLLNAQARLHEFFTAAKTDLEKAGAIQAFEFSYELCWKTMKRMLAKRKVDVYSPMQSFRHAALEKFINDPEPWFAFADMRNRTVHTYDQKVANEIFGKLSSFIAEMDKFIAHIQRITA